MTDLVGSQTVGFLTLRLIFDFSFSFVLVIVRCILVFSDITEIKVSLNKF